MTRMFAPLALLVLLALASIAPALAKERECDGDVLIQFASDIELWKHCSRITGSLQLYNTSDVTTLEGFAELKRIDKDVYLWKNLGLTSLSLPALEVVGGQVDILANPQLQSLAGLAKLRSVGGHLKVWANERLTSVAGLDSVTRIGGIEIMDNIELRTLQGLLPSSFLTLDGSLVVADNRNLESISGLDSLATVKGNVRIASNGPLSSLQGLQNLHTVEGDLEVVDHEELHDLTQLSKLTRVGGAAGQGRVTVGPLHRSVRCLPPYLLAHADASQFGSRSASPLAPALIACDRLFARLRKGGYPVSMKGVLEELDLVRYLPTFEREHVHLEQLLDLFAGEPGSRSSTTTHSDTALAQRLQELVVNDDDREQVRRWVNTQNRWLRSEHVDKDL